MHARDSKDGLSLRIIVNEGVSWLRFLNVSKSWDQPLLRGAGAHCTEGLRKAIKPTAKYQVVTCEPHPHPSPIFVTDGRCENKITPIPNPYAQQAMRRKRRKTTRSNHYAAVSRVLNYILTRAEYLSQQRRHL